MFSEFHFHFVLATKWYKFKVHTRQDWLVFTLLTGVSSSLLRSKSQSLKPLSVIWGKQGSIWVSQIHVDRLFYSTAHFERFLRHVNQCSPCCPESPNTLRPQAAAMLYSSLRAPFPPFQPVDFLASCLLFFAFKKILKYCFSSPLVISRNLVWVTEFVTFLEVEVSNCFVKHLLGGGFCGQ